jgi:hypothetical protein
MRIRYNYQGRAYTCTSVGLSDVYLRYVSAGVCFKTGRTGSGWRLIYESAEMVRPCMLREDPHFFRELLKFLGGVSPSDEAKILRLLLNLIAGMASIMDRRMLKRYRFITFTDRRLTRNNQATKHSEAVSRGLTYLVTLLKGFFGTSHVEGQKVLVASPVSTLEAENYLEDTRNLRKDYTQSLRTLFRQGNQQVEHFIS